MGASSGFDEYQRRGRETIHGDRGQKRFIASMLGLASETGSILDSYKRYLRDSIDWSANQEFLSEELGDLLWYIAAVASACNLRLHEIAEANLRKPRRPRLSGGTPKTTDGGRRLDVVARDPIVREFAAYQQRTNETCRLDLSGPDGAVSPMLGLAFATGSILTPEKSPRLDATSSTLKTRFRRELGDLLGYVSAVATASDLNLGEIAAKNLKRSHDLYTVVATPFPKLFRQLPSLDDPKQPTECFPRKLIIRFVEKTVGIGPPTAKQRIIDAIPNAFPKGPIKVGAKLQGFSLNVALGDMTTDNLRSADGYRYHDAIHLAFAAVLGWSPVVRRLLRLKRKSKPDTDRDEDGARAVFTEEGLVAILSKLAPRRMGFLGENTVDGQVIAMAQAAVQALEIESAPGWLWRRAISQGFQAMTELRSNKGGYLSVDLDQRSLVYSKTRPG